MQNSKTIGICLTCHRHMALTKHHLIPKKSQKKKVHDESMLNEVIVICRQCHDGIHDFYDERTIAVCFNTLEKLLDHATLKKHFLWVSKCKKGIK